MSIGPGENYDKLNEARYYRSYRRAGNAKGRESEITEYEDRVKDEIGKNGRNAGNGNEYR